MYILTQNDCLFFWKCQRKVNATPQPVAQPYHAAEPPLASPLPGTVPVPVTPVAPATPSSSHQSSIYHHHIEHFFSFLAGNTVFSLIRDSPH